MLLTAEAVTPTITPIENYIGDQLTTLQKMWNQFWPGALDFGIKLIIGIVLLIIGKLIIKLIIKLLSNAFGKSKADKGVVSFVTSLTKGGLYVVLGIIICQVVGIPTASLIALLGSAGLAIGLALQGSLSNFAGGILILILKPFKVGDYIVTGDGEGSVTRIDIFYTRLKTPDNRVVVIPNGALSNSAVTNVSKESTRRIDLVVPVSYSADIKQVRSILTAILDEQGKKVLKDKGIDIVVDEFADSSINIKYRFWVNASNYWPVRFEVMERIKEKFDAEGIEIPFNQMDVHVKND